MPAKYKERKVSKEKMILVLRTKISALSSTHSFLSKANKKKQVRELLDQA